MTCEWSSPLQSEHSHFTLSHRDRVMVVASSRCTGRTQSLLWELNLWPLRRKAKRSENYFHTETRAGRAHYVWFVNFNQVLHGILWPEEKMFPRTTVLIRMLHWRYLVRPTDRECHTEKEVTGQKTLQSYAFQPKEEVTVFALISNLV